VTAKPPSRRDIAMVFQDYALYPHMTILDNIGYPLKVRGTARDELVERVTAVAKSLQIPELLDRRPAQLSGGQQQRAAVGRAVVHRPAVFLFDEPLSNLDAKLRLEARAFLKHLQHEVGITSVYVTHDQAEAMALANRMAVMQAGRLVQVGTPLEIYREPRTTFVASFIGSPPMNLIPCRIERTTHGVQLAGDGFHLDISPLQARVPPDLHDEEVVMGIRPEHLTLNEQEGAQRLAGEVYVVQPLGTETLVNLLVDGETVSVRLLTDEPPDLPERVWLEPDLSRLRLYRADGELAL
jgi:ABC-type sugar transport system ATPase subunit